MTLACSVEVVHHCVDLKARVTLKTDRSVFNATIAFGSKQKKQKAQKGIHKLLRNHQARSKQLEAKCQKQNLSYDWTLTITW